VAKLVPQATDTIGQRLARIRKASGLTQKELAARLGVTQSVVSDYEHDVLRLHGELIVELGEILGVSPNELLGKDAGDRATTARPPGRLVRKLQAIAQLPKRDQEALFRTIEAFLRNAS
jgi:transcriptional regulator with XRE-family HTH domain